jgi:hypothetical protein
MRGQIIQMLDALSHRPAEHAWIKTCKLRAARGEPRRPVMDPLEHLTLTALDRCVFLGWITPAGFAVLAKYGANGPPDQTDTAARQEWDGAIDVLQAEMYRLVFPPPTPKVPPRDGFFWGPRGTPFANAANAWWWALDCLEARAEGARDQNTMRIGRPCEPDDVVNALRRLDLSAIHARTVMAWGKRRDTPPANTAARQYWDEVMARLTVALREKGIVRPDQRVAPAKAEVVAIQVRDNVTRGRPKQTDEPKERSPGRVAVA